MQRGGRRGRGRRGLEVERIGFGVFEMLQHEYLLMAGHANRPA